ncbi:MAG: hypothetical protein GX992_08825 [Clostridium sp.]|nr:hypothetical protein [Clostridium sp.]
MYVIYVKNYKRRFFYLSIIITLWVALFLLTETFINTNHNTKMSIKNQFSFSCPGKYCIEDIYINETINDSFIQANVSLKSAVTKRFSAYKSGDSKFSFKYPSAFSINEYKFGGGEILYHVTFKDKVNPSHGFVQVWELPYDLNEFLEDSISHFGEQISNFSSSPVIVDHSPGIYWNYVITTEKGENFRGCEAFFKKKGRMYRISYFVPEHLWNKNEEKIYKKIVSSFKVGK